MMDYSLFLCVLEPEVQVVQYAWGRKPLGGDSVPLGTQQLMQYFIEFSLQANWSTADYVVYLKM
jgi:hypothetical protein